MSPEPKVRARAAGSVPGSRHREGWVSVGYCRGLNYYQHCGPIVPDIAIEAYTSAIPQSRLLTHMSLPYSHVEQLPR